jgi:hypothetical protein
MGKARKCEFNTIKLFLKKESICKRLVPLASLAGQRRFVIHGNKDEYWSPTDILEDAQTVLHQVKNFTVFRDSLTELELAAILEIEPFLNAENLQQALKVAIHPCEGLIEHDFSWKALREQVAKSLEILGFDLAEWEKSEGIV